MREIDYWSLALLVVAAYIAVSVLIRTMWDRHRNLTRQLRKESRRRIRRRQQQYGEHE